MYGKKMLCMINQTPFVVKARKVKVCTIEFIKQIIALDSPTILQKAYR